jgi:hypothetical protein
MQPPFTTCEWWAHGFCPGRLEMHPFFSLEMKHPPTQESSFRDDSIKHLLYPKTDEILASSSDSNQERRRSQ